MEVLAEKSVVITLILNKHEAIWLKGFIQNSPCLGLETVENADIRHSLFISLEERLGE